MNLPFISNTLTYRPSGCNVSHHICKRTVAVNSIEAGDAKQLSAHMSKYWVNFAVTGDPNDAQLPKWPQYSLATDMDLRLDIGASGIG